MTINVFEHSVIQNAQLPPNLKAAESLNNFEDFLQTNWNQRAIFYEDNYKTSDQQFIKFIRNNAIKTSKYIGTIIYQGEKINIFPKVFKEFKDDNDTSNLTEKHLFHNIVNWIEYCNKFDYPFLNISAKLKDSDSLMDLFITLYIGYVSSSIERGLYYQYIDQTDNLKVIKGKFNVVDYVTKKIPYGQYNEFECSYSSFEYDNLINRIIKYTCNQLLKITSGKNLKKLRRIMNKLDQVTLTPCSPNDCDNIRLNNMQKQYKIILSMSKMILLNKFSAYDMDINESFCFLFPTELLFEGFIGGFMKETLTNIGGKVKLQQSNMPLIEEINYNDTSLGSAFTMKHDIVATLGNKIIILDTKYKEISRFNGDVKNVSKIIKNEPKQTDLYQILEYARKRNIRDVYLLYPMYRYETKEPYFPTGISKSESLNINIHFIRLPFIFEDDQDIKKTLKDIILDFFYEKKQ